MKKRKPGPKGWEGYNKCIKAKDLYKYLGMEQPEYNPGGHVLYHRMQDIRGEFGRGS